MPRIWRHYIQHQRQLARNIAIRADADPSSAYSNKPRGHEEGDGNDIGIANCTRLGKPSVIVVPLYILDKGVALAPDAEPFDLDVPLSTALACLLCARQLSLANQSLVKVIKQQPEVQAFAQSPLLRYSYPLLLDREGSAQWDGGLRVRLDRELGLICRNKEESEE